MKNNWSCLNSLITAKPEGVISPSAVYYYSTYGPGLNLLARFTADRLVDRVLPAALC